MPTEPGHDPSHLQFTNSAGSWPAPCGNILVTFSDFFRYFTKKECRQWFLTGKAELNIN
jgi:hypothetical protein